MQSENPVRGDSGQSDAFEAGRFVAGLAAGAAIGAGLALLFAPQTGEEARRNASCVCAGMADRAVELGRERLSTALDAARGRTASACDGATSAIEEWISAGKHIVEDAHQRLDSAVTAGREAYRSRRAELEAEIEASTQN